MITKTNKNGQLYHLKENKNRFFFPEEYMKFEDSLKSKQKHTIKCLLNTGARINEMRNVKVYDIKFGKLNTNIELRVTKCKAMKGEKRGTPRLIPISSKFAKYLKGYIDEHKLTEDSYLNILSTPAIDIAIKKTALKVGIKDYYNFSAHSLRKTLEVWLMSLGVDSLPLTAHLGHDIRTAAQNYVSPDIFNWQDKQKMREIIGDLYQK